MPAAPSGAAVRHGAGRGARTRALFQAAAGCTDETERRQLLDEVVTLNLEVADTLAAQYVGRGVSLDDLSQTARMALVRVTRSFSLDRQCDFLAYAVPSIRGTLKRYFRDHCWVVRPPRRLQEARLDVNGARQDLEHSLGREPTVAELSDLTGLGQDMVTEALMSATCYSPDSLDRPVGAEDDATLGAVVGAEDPDYERVEQRRFLASLMRDFPDRDRRVIELRFVAGMTQEEIGQRIGVSQMQVSRMLARLLDQLRARALEQQSPPQRRAG
jgi:RNA polymerase sigma-B factor